MNEPQSREADSLRSDINVTRRRMDDTMDALGERLEPRHLLDEFLGFFRRSTEGSGKVSQWKDKITESADTAMHSVIDTVKKNPMPALLVGAGVAWMIYEANRKEEPEGYPRRAWNYHDQPEREGVRYDPDMHYDRPLQYPEGSAQAEWSDQGGSKLGEVKEKLTEKTQAATEQVKEKLSRAGDVAREKAGMLKERAGEKLQAVRERAGELGQRVGERTREMYAHTRERVATTAEERPLELGLVCLAAGVIAGLALRTPRAVHRMAGPTADELRRRTREAGREMMDKGRRVAQAAMSAAKDEAEAQGLTPEGMRQEITEGNQSGSQINDPTVARPA